MSNNGTLREISQQTGNQGFFPLSWISGSSVDIEGILAMKYLNRKVSTNDPTPIPIDCVFSGPLKVAGGNVMCEICGGITRASYLDQHRRSGACSRKANSRRKGGVNLVEETGGRLSRSSENLTRESHENSNRIRLIQSIDLELEGSGMENIRNTCNPLL